MSRLASFSATSILRNGFGRIIPKSDQRTCERGAGRAGAGVRGALCADRAAVNRTGEAVASDAPASLLFNSLGAAIDGAAGVRSAVPLVRGHRRRRRGVGSLSFFQEPRAPVTLGSPRGEFPPGLPT